MKKGRGKDPGTAPSTGGRTVPGWIKILVGFHVLATIVWTLPQPTVEVAQGRIQPQATGWLLYWNAKYLKTFRPIRSYILGTGAWQYWDMFAPQPAATDYYCTADITYLDGSVRSVAYPRIHDLPIPMKYVKERYRKFFERVRDTIPPQPRLWPNFAQTIAFHAYTDPQNPPLVVRLREHSRVVAPPGQPQPTEYQNHVYYAYAVDQAWLKRAAGKR